VGVGSGVGEFVGVAIGSSVGEGVSVGEGESVGVGVFSGGRTLVGDSVATGSLDLEGIQEGSFRHPDVNKVIIIVSIISVVILRCGLFIIYLPLLAFF
jgi:hypothetical protein